jgi:hypothetical protein
LKGESQSLTGGDDRSYPTKTVSVLIENDGRVFRIERGTVVKYMPFQTATSSLSMLARGSRINCGFFLL